MSNMFEIFNLDELKSLLKQTLEFASPRDKDFIHNLCHEIADREKKNE